MKKLESVSYKNVKLTGGFWKKWQETVAMNTVNAVYEQFAASGRISAMTHTWREGEENRPHIFYDSDIAKWMEGAAYILQYAKNPELEDKVDAIVNLIEDGMSSEGYFNSYYQTIEPANRWTNRVNHELYCAGHLMEAAVAYYEVTGKRKFLDLMCRYADYIEEIFVQTEGAKFHTPGHEEIELALVKLYKATGEERYLALSKHFIDVRGTREEMMFDFFKNHPTYAQDQNPVREQQSAEGHVVRYTYLFSGAADIAKEYGDTELLEACERTFDEAVRNKMYITGGMGNMKHGEAFGPAYFLPNFEAYTETCASIGFMFLAKRILNMDPDSRFADNMELQMYNGALAGISLDGNSFFYENPLEQKPTDLEFFHRVGANGRPASRVRLFGCSCCPPNILRLIASLGDYYYSTDGECTIYTHLYGANRAEIKLGEKKIVLTQSTHYPEDGRVTIRVTAKDPVKATLAFRIPGWCKNATVTCGGKSPDRIEKGYAYFDGEWKTGDKVELNFRMDVRVMEADPRVYADCGKVALMRGPMVYCLEETDNGQSLGDIRLSAKPGFKVKYEPDLLSGVTTITFRGSRRDDDFGGALYREYNPVRKEEQEFKAIPYYAWNNRGEGELAVWILR
ncbi:MAG: glycoside hydrolase family 127 protein [Clostridia bacterium]|nr:glycoside hydrolase family 127 protein [Clostridia bacterium]